MPEMSKEAQAKLTAFNATQTDWFTLCPKCRAKLTGTLAELKTHCCGPDGQS